MSRERRAKQVAAAIAAVMQYVAEVEAQQPEPGSETARSLGGQPFVWALAGRQDSMAYRSFWQRRLAKSW